MIGKPFYNIINKVSWFYLSENPNAIPILEQNLDKVVWLNLSFNPNAIPILEQNMDKIKWSPASYVEEKKAVEMKAVVVKKDSSSDDEWVDVKKSL